MADRTYSTGLVPATSADLYHLADAAERWQRGDVSAARDLECRIFAAMLSHQGWEYVAPRPAVPAVKEGRKIVKREVRATGPGIRRHWTTPGDERGWGRSSGSEETRPPAILTDMREAWGWLHGRVLITLSDIGADGMALAHVCGGEGMRAEGKAMGGATMAATLTAAVLRCEAMARELVA